MSIDSALSKANKAQFSVVGVLVSLTGILFIFHSTVKDNAFEYGYGSLVSGAQVIALGTLLQHTKKLTQK